VEVWSKTENDLGTCAAMVGPATVPLLTRLLDGESPLVYLEGFDPPLGSGYGWNDVVLPLAIDRSERVTARYVGFDVLLPTSTFLDLADDLVDQGLYCAQVQRTPPDGVRQSALKHPAARRNWYEKVGLVVAFSLPHRNESAQVSALSSALLDAALARLV
jgi:hypothetical protein